MGLLEELVPRIFSIPSVRNALVSQRKCSRPSTEVLAALSACRGSCLHALLVNIRFTSLHTKERLSWPPVSRSGSS